MDDDGLRALARRSSIRNGRIAGEVAENSFTGKPLALRFQLHLELQPVADGTGVPPTIAIASLGLPIRDWPALAGTTWNAPADRGVAYVDGDAVPANADGLGTLTVADDLVPVSCVRIRFGDVAAHGIGAEISLSISSAAAAGIGGGIPLAFTTTLAIGPIRIIGDAIRVGKPQRAAALALAGRFLNVSAFAVQEEGGIVALQWTGASGSR